MLRRFIAVVSAGSLAACTHISTLPDIGVTPRDQALNGTSYALPMLQYKLDIMRALRKCPKQATLKGDGNVPSITLTDTGLSFQVKVTPTPRYIPWESYTADYRALSSFLKTTGYGIVTYPSGTLKSVNVSAEDHSAEVVKAAAAAGLTIATMGAGSPIAASSLLATTKLVKSAGGTRGGGGKTRRVTRIDGDYADALRSLGQLTTTSQAVLCTPEAVAALAAIKANADAQEEATKALSAATKDVERFTILANLKKGRASDVSNLDDALKRQNARALELQGLTDARAELDGAVAVTSTDYWPHKPLDKPEVLKPTTDGVGKLRKLLEVATVRTITPLNLRNWYQGLTPALRKRIWKENEALLKPFIREDGSASAIPAPVQTPCTASTPDIDACLMDAVTVTASLMASSGDRPLCKEGDLPASGCLSTVNVDADQKTGRFAMDDKPDPGIFIRTPAEGLFVICRRSSQPADDCPVDRQLVRLDAISAPQLGQLRFLPFSSKAFESATLAVSLREDGSLDTLTYAKTKAAGTEVASTASDIATKVQGYMDQRDAKRAAGLTAARAEAIAQVQFQIDLLTKQATLLKLQNPTDTETIDAINEQIGQINSQTALLEAKLSKLKAEASYAAAGGE